MFILYMGESGSFLLVVDPAEHREKGKTWGAIRMDDLGLSEDYGEKHTLSDLQWFCIIFPIHMTNLLGVYSQVLDTPILCPINNRLTS